jgi:uncharacterized protein YutE (UPF0331/DUF86 family)
MTSEKAVLLAKLEHLQNCLYRLESKLGWISQDLKTQFIKAVGLRNVLVHEYDDIQWDIVYTVVSEHMDVFKKFAKAINEKAHLVDTKG